MTQRVFGPVRGAGVQVTELESDRPIQTAPLGVTCYFGKTRKGDVGELMAAPTKADMLRRVGDYVEGSELPEAAFDFYAHSNGRGELYFVRLTDGTEVSAKETVFSRHVGHGLFAGTEGDAGWDEFKRPLFTLTAKNGGRWGSRNRVLTGKVADEAADISATTIATLQTMLLDEWAGATLRLAGVTAKTYTVVSNSTAGVVTVESDQDMETDLANGSDPTNDKYELVLDAETMTFPTSAAGTRRGLSYLVKDGEESETSLFGLEVYEDEQLVLDYPNLSLDPDSKWYMESVINEDVSNYWVTATVLFTGSITTDTRPANFYGQALDWAADTVTVQIAHVRSVTSAGATPGWVGDFTYHATKRVKKQKITLTFTGATTFTIATSAADGAEITGLTAGTVGTAVAAANRHTIGFTVFAGLTAFQAGDTIVIDVLPLPVDEDGEGLLAGGYVYYDVGTDRRKRIQIKENTSNTITLTSAPDSAPDEALVATDVINSGVLTFPLTVTPTLLEIQHSHFGTVSMTLATPAANIADLVADINTKWQAATSSTGDIAADGGGNSLDLMLDDSGADTNKGYESFLIIGASNAALNLTAGQSIIGEVGAEFRVQARQELRDGYDGGEPADSDFIAAASPAVDSLVSRFYGQNKGLVKLATPGVTSTDVQRAFLELAAAYSYQYRCEIPSNITDESAAIAYVNDTIGRNDFAVYSWPSYAYVPNQQGQGTVLRSLTGAIHGREAFVAATWDGYHKAAAGEDVTLPQIVRLPTGNRVLNEEILNPQGINVIKKLKGNFVIWGDRTAALDPTWTWKHQRELMSHYERQLLEAYTFVIFAINDPITQLSLTTSLQNFFLPEWRKRALRGDKFKDACQIKIDAGNNTNATRAAGDLNCDLILQLADTVERFRIRVGKAGVAESVA